MMTSRLHARNNEFRVYCMQPALKFVCVNLHRHQNQLSDVVFVDNGRANGTSYYYDAPDPTACASVPLHVGLLKPDWLGGAAYVGAREVGGFTVDCWEQGRAPPPHQATLAFVTYALVT